MSRQMAQMAKEKLAFVLGGGGARGALQVGALRALLEADIRPGLVTGTSIGALNAAFLGLHGFSAASLDALTEVWREAATADLLPANYLWLTVRTLFGRGGGHLEDRILPFLTAHGLDPELRFRDLTGVPVRLVAADLNSYRPRVYGADPEESVLAAVLASAALPPWIHPLTQENHLLLDGGFVSNVPIEAALAAQATRLIVLDISDPRAFLGNLEPGGFAAWFEKLASTILQRQIDLELALAAAHKVPVLHLQLRFEHPVAIWDFSHTEELIAAGYALARAEIAHWSAQRRSWLRRLLP